MILSGWEIVQALLKEEITITPLMNAGKQIGSSSIDVRLGTEFKLGQYDENNRELQLDHSKLSDFIESKDGNRDLSATVSCHNEVLKDLIRKQQELGKANIYIEQLQKQNRLLQARLVKLEAVVARLNISEKGGTK